MKKISILLFFLIVMMILGGNTVFAEETIKIGFSDALTGSASFWGNCALEGVKLAIEDVNAKGGVLGKQIELIAYDDRYDKAEIANSVRRLIAQGVSAIITHSCTGGCYVAAPICQESKVVMMAPNAGGPGVGDVGDYIFRNGLLNEFAVPGFVNFLINERNYKKFAMIVSINNDYAVSMSDQFKESIKELGGKIVIEETMADGDIDFSAQITKIKNSEAEIIIFTGYYTEGALILKEARKQGCNLVIAGGDGLESPQFMKLAREAAEGSMIFTSYFPSKELGETANFVKKWEEAYGKKAENSNVLGYDAIMILAEAMKRANSFDPEIFKNEIIKMEDFDGASGKIGFLPNGEPVKKTVFIRHVKDGELSLLKAVPNLKYIEMFGSD